MFTQFKSGRHFLRQHPYKNIPGYLLACLKNLVVLVIATLMAIHFRKLKSDGNHETYWNYSLVSGSSWHYFNSQSIVQLLGNHIGKKIIFF